MCKGPGALNTICAPVIVVLHCSTVKYVRGEEGGSRGERGARRWDEEVGRARKSKALHHDKDI